MRVTDTSDLWWKNAVVYCLDVETFLDSDGDGRGDLPGLAQRIDYLAELGVTCLWLMPFYPTPDREARIVMMRASSVAESTARAVVAAVGRLRREPLTKPPGVAEAVDWAEAATLLHQRGARWPDAFRRAIGVALQDEEDLTYVSGRLDQIIAEAAA